MDYPNDFKKLIDFFKLLPGVGNKTSERYAFSILHLDSDKKKEISDLIKSIDKNVVTCQNCWCLKDNNECYFCNIDSGIMCVVENQKNVFVLNKLGLLNMKFHVLGGLISPINGINPENINIDNLIKRIECEKIKEIILALSPGIEGNTTSLYIKKLLEKKDVKVTQLAQGLPIGTEMEYLDGLTIEMALSNRNEIS